MTASVAFWQSTVFVGEPASFQLVLTPLPGALRALVFTSLHLYWDEHEPPVVIDHSDECPADAVVQLGNLSSSTAIDTPIKKEQSPVTSLRWEPNHPKTFAGSIETSVPAQLQVGLC